MMYESNTVEFWLEQLESWGLFFWDGVIYMKRWFGHIGDQKLSFVCVKLEMPVRQSGGDVELTIE